VSSEACKCGRLRCVLVIWKCGLLVGLVMVSVWGARSLMRGLNEVGGSFNRTLDRDMAIMSEHMFDRVLARELIRSWQEDERHEMGDVVRRLMKMGSSDDPYVRSFAAVALGEMDDEDAAIDSVIATLSKDTDLRVSEAARLSLKLRNVNGKRK